MTIHYYDRHGMPIGLERWGQLFADLSQRVVAADHVNDIWISTVWLGLDHNYGPGPPLIFETMVFDTGAPNFNSKWRDLEMRRYSTEAEALAGHAEILELVKKLESIKEPDKDPTERENQP